MSETAADKLFAEVVEVIDLGTLFPKSVLHGQVGLDIRVEQGSVSIGKTVLLSDSHSEEEVEIVGFEMPGRSSDPNVVRVHCSRPETLAISTGKVEGWTIAEE